MGHQKTFAKKAPDFFGLPVENIKISDIIYKIQNFIGTSRASIITTTPINFLIAGDIYRLLANQGFCCIAGPSRIIQNNVFS